MALKYICIFCNFFFLIISCKLILHAPDRFPTIFRSSFSFRYFFYICSHSVFLFQSCLLFHLLLFSVMRPLLFFLLPILSLSIPLGKQTGYDDAEARRLVKLAAAAYGDRHATCISK